MRVDYGSLIVDQLDFYWNVHLWPRLDGLTDREYRWEPVPGCRSVRAAPDGRWFLDETTPEPSPPPATTIAWRMIHIAHCMARRTNTFFAGDPDDDADIFAPGRLPPEIPGTAADSLDLLEREYWAWQGAVRGLDTRALEAPLGPRGAFFSDEPMIALVVHVNREVMHHGGEIGVLRDLYRAGLGGPTGG